MHDDLARVVNEITNIYENSPYDMVHASTLAKRILFSSDFDELQAMLTECVRITSLLFKEENAAYFVYMAIQVRLGYKITNIRKRDDERAGEYERSMYLHFAENPQRYIPGTVILSPKNRGGSRPDFFLEVNGVFSVAEFKVNGFRQRDLYQLQEYMERYKAPNGYAVAPSLCCTLPNNVTFVKMYPLKKKGA